MLIAGPTAADDFNEIGDAYCVKTSQCTIEQMSEAFGDKHPPEYYQTLHTIMMAQCDETKIAFGRDVSDTTFRSKGKACLASVANQECEQVNNRSFENVTAACREFHDYISKTKPSFSSLP